MKIGLQFAMPAEFHALPGARDLSPVETVSGVPFFEAAPGILACAGGVSKVNAAMAAEIFCLKYGVELILNAGVAGCATDLPTGSLVVASEFVQHDVDTTAVGDPIGLVSTVNQVAFPTWEPERLRRTAQGTGRLRRHRPSRHRRLVRRQGRAGPVDPGHLLSPAGGDGGMRHCSGLPAQRRAVRLPQVCVRPPVFRQSEGGILRFRAGAGSPGPGSAAAGPSPCPGILLN